MVHSPAVDHISRAADHISRICQRVELLSGDQDTETPESNALAVIWFGTSLLSVGI